MQYLQLLYDSILSAKGNWKSRKNRWDPKVHLFYSCARVKCTTTLSLTKNIYSWFRKSNKILKSLTVNLLVFIRTKLSSQKIKPELLLVNYLANVPKNCIGFILTATYSGKITTTFITQIWLIWDLRTVDKTTKLYSVPCHIIVFPIQEIQKFYIKLQNIFWKLIHSFYNTHKFARKLWKQICHQYEVGIFLMLFAVF